MVIDVPSTVESHTASLVITIVIMTATKYVIIVGMVTSVKNSAWNMMMVCVVTLGVILLEIGKMFCLCGGGVATYDHNDDICGVILLEIGTLFIYGGGDDGSAGVYNDDNNDVFTVLISTILHEDVYEDGGGGGCGDACLR